MNKLVETVATWIDNFGAFTRLWPLWVWAVLAFVVVLVLQPVQIGILFWGALKIFTGGIVGFLFYAVIQRYARPGKDPTAMHEIHWMYIRAVLVAAGMYAGGANL
jgi:hypothetical protein